MEAVAGDLSVSVIEIVRCKIQNLSLFSILYGLFSAPDITMLMILLLS